jgi:preprotein translocase subunit SecE
MQILYQIDFLLHSQILRFLNSQILHVNKVTNYFKESYKELMEKVTWPSWSELQQSTVIVLVATLLITVMVYVMDIFSNGVLKFIYSLLS